MFSVGDYVVCGNKGVCRVDQISPLDISGASSEDYYILKPVYSPGSTVYISMESAVEKLRAVLTKKEADKLIKQMPGVLDITVDNDKSSSRPFTTGARRDLPQAVRRPHSMRSISAWPEITSTESLP